MKLFKTVQRNFALLDFNRNHNDRLFNRRNFLGVIIFVLGIVHHFTFVILSANTPEDYMDSAYILAVSVSIFVSYVTTIYKMTKLFDFFDDCENIRNKSKFDFIKIL